MTSLGANLKNNLWYKISENVRRKQWNAVWDEVHQNVWYSVREKIWYDLKENLHD